MDDMANDYLKLFNIKNDFNGWTGINNPTELEIESGIWVTKAGARFFPKGFMYNPESNRHWEWGAILEGGLEFEYNNQNVKAQKGSCYIMPPDLFLTARPINKPFLVWIEINGPVSVKAIQKVSGKSNNLVLNKFTLEQMKHILTIAHLLHEHPYGYELSVHNNLWGFLANSIYPGNPSSRSVTQEIQNVIVYLKNQKTIENCTLHQLAQIAGLPVETFRKRFLNETGESPIKYLLKTKIKRAKELLSIKGLTLKEVAQETGFDDPYYFSRIFKKYEGLSPTEYRKRFYPEIYFNPLI